MIPNETGTEFFPPRPALFRCEVFFPEVPRSSHSDPLTEKPDSIPSQAHHNTPWHGCHGLWRDQINAAVSPRQALPTGIHSAKSRRSMGIISGSLKSPLWITLFSTYQ